MSIQQQLRRHLLSFRQHIVFLRLASQHPLRLITVSLALAVLLVGVLHRDLLVREVLPVHVRNRVVGGFERGVRDEAVALGETGLVARDLGRCLEGPEAGEGVVERLLVDEEVQAADEELGAYFDWFLLVC